MKAAAKDYFDEYAKEYEAQGRYQYLFYRWLVDGIIRQVKKQKCGIVDLGTGNGELALRIAKKFPKSRIIGVDVSKGMMKVAMGKARKVGIKNLEFRASSIEKFGIIGADYFVSNLVFHHVEDKAGAISRICRSLPDGGKLVIGDYFKPTEEYKEGVERLRNKNMERAKEFDLSRAQSLRGASKEYWERHPKEYLVCPTELKRIMEGAGFRKSRILMSPLADFAIVVGEK